MRNPFTPEVSVSLSKCRRLPRNGLRVSENRAALVAGWSAGREVEALGARGEHSDAAGALLVFSWATGGDPSSSSRGGGGPADPQPLPQRFEILSLLGASLLLSYCFVSASQRTTLQLSRLRKVKARKVEPGAACPVCLGCCGMK